LLFNPYSETISPQQRQLLEELTEVGYDCLRKALISPAYVSNVFADYLSLPITSVNLKPTDYEIISSPQLSRIIYEAKERLQDKSGD
jgi:hypothetical protein